MTRAGRLRSLTLHSFRIALQLSRIDQPQLEEAMSKFNEVPVEADTRILFQEQTTLGEYEVLHQKWVWDGITAESIIFANEDIAGVTDHDLEMHVKAFRNLAADTSMTLKQSESGFTFVNFNFEAD
jgi:hypothetical protein